MQPRPEPRTISAHHRAATIDDVARAAGVSRSAVSRSFTAGASASAATRAKVKAAAAALGYRPNLVARSLSTQRSHVVAIGTARLDNGFNADLLQIITLGLAAAGLRTLLFASKGGTDSDPPIDEILRHRVDAVVLLATRISSGFAGECAAARVPLVLVNRATVAPAVSTILGDNETGGRQIADFLLAGGHQHFAFLAGIEDSSTSRDRERGFTDRLRQAGMPVMARAVGHYDQTRAASAMRRLMGRRDRPDAIFCANDHMAIAALGVARREFNCAIGHDLSIVGFDDAPAAAWSGIELTSFTQPIHTIGQRATDAVLAHLRDPATLPVHDVVSGELVVRASARLPATRLHHTSDGRTVWCPDK